MSGNFKYKFQGSIFLYSELEMPQEMIIAYAQSDKERVKLRISKLELDVTVLA